MGLFREIPSIQVTWIEFWQFNSFWNTRFSIIGRWIPYEWKFVINFFSLSCFNLLNKFVQGDIKTIHLESLFFISKFIGISPVFIKINLSLFCLKLSSKTKIVARTLASSIRTDHDSRIHCKSFKSAFKSRISSSRVSLVPWSKQITSFTACKVLNQNMANTKNSKDWNRVGGEVTSLYKSPGKSKSFFSVCRECRISLGFFTNGFTATILALQRCFKQALYNCTELCCMGTTKVKTVGTTRTKYGLWIISRINVCTPLAIYSWYIWTIVISL